MSGSLKYSALKELKETRRWTQNWLHCWIQGVLISSTKSSWAKFISGASQGLILGPILCNIV